ncbi:MAG TPA: aminotransferase class III-fold pyridoxal phosphate-dependent enzyme [Bdellovibrionales bacterium]|nr:aminotransferase class III-fold pyridoxal phosphate-dependent enzyme [Bdellovibrionales bacterium]
MIKLLESIRLDKTYHRAEGDHLWFNEGGREHRVLDMVGGFGTTLLGHNHPALKSVINDFLARNAGINTQGSVKAVSRELALKLSELAGKPGEYRCILTNSGAETVEAAIKHAELYRTSKLGELRAAANEVWARLTNERTTEVCALTAEAARLLGFGDEGGEPAVAIADARARLEERNKIPFLAGPVFLALKGGFHGKTSGALKLTYNSEYKRGLDHLGPLTVFIDPSREGDLQGAWESQRLTYLMPVIANGKLHVEERSLYRWAAIITEPIQGEGGIRPVSPQLLRAMRELATRFDVPFIVDEIQSGLGRTGSFLACQHDGIEPDYILLSKSLGGGIMKIGALLIHSKVYIPEFSLIQTSTFAEDELSSSVALKTLELLFANGSEAMRKVDLSSQRLLSGLRELQARFPRVIRDVRGRGLMIGIELADWHLADADMFRAISDSRQVAAVLAGHLLNEERVRVLPTLSDPFTIRLEPSLGITSEDIEWFLAAFGRVCEIIQTQDEARLLKFMFEKEHENLSTKPKRRARPSPFEEPEPGAPRVAFLAHFAKYGMIREQVPAFAHFTDDECKRFFHRFAKGKPGPWHLGSKNIKLRSGKTVHFNCIGLLHTSEQFMESYHGGSRGELVRLIDEGLDLAVGLGCSVVGLGMFTSVVTRNGLDLTRDDICITSGNSLTVALGVDAVIEQIKSRAHRGLTLAAIGAAGNICRTYVRELSPHFTNVILVGSGRPGSERRLGQIGAELKLRAPAAAASRRSSSLEAALFVERSFEPAAKPASGVRVTSDMNLLRDADVVISATNDPGYLIFPRHLKEGALVCDISFPPNVSPEVREKRPDVSVIHGGVAETPYRDDLELAFFPIQGDRVYACMAETALLGAAGRKSHFSYGDLEPEKIKYIRSLFYEEGFRLVADKGWHNDKNR